jgi:hypothetical protein
MGVSSGGREGHDRQVRVFKSTSWLISALTAASRVGIMLPFLTRGVVPVKETVLSPAAIQVLPKFWILSVLARTEPCLLDDVGWLAQAREPAAAPCCLR